MLRDKICEADAVILITDCPVDEVPENLKCVVEHLDGHIYSWIIVWTYLFTPWRHGTWQTSCHSDQMASWRLTKFNCGKNSSSATVLWLVVQCWSKAGNSWTMCFMKPKDDHLWRAGVLGARCLKEVMGIKTDPNGRYSSSPTLEKARFYQDRYHQTC